MKKFFALVITLMVVTFCVQAQTLLSESFDTGSLPTGWTVIDSDGDGYNWDANTPFVNDWNVYSGAGCIASASFINNIGVLYPDNWLITPAIDLTSDAQLIFHVRGQDASYSAENYTVYISTTGATVADFDSVLITGTTTATYETKTVDLSNYTGETVYIAFRHHNTSDMYWLNLDEVSVFATPTTPTIGVSPLSVDLGTVILGDTASGTISVVGYSLTGSITATATAPFLISTDGVTYGSTATLPQNGGTIYVAYVPTTAGEETGTVTLSATGATSVTVDLTSTGLDCSNIALPITQSFESIEDLNCWSAHSMSNNQMGRADNDASSGTMAFYFSSYQYSSQNYNQYLITPVLPNTMNKMITFDYEAYSLTAEPFKVGYSTADTISISDFIWGPTISAPATTTAGSWQTYINAAIPAEAKYIAINYCQSYQGYYLFIDNLSIAEVTGCMTPVSVNASNITQSTASINWTPIGFEEAWSVVVVEEGGDPDQGVPVVATDHPYIVEGLLPATEYDVYVSANCESGNSPWSTAATFTTTPDCSNPSNPLATNILGTSATISWNAAPYGVTSYVVEYGIAESGSTQQVTVDSSTTVILTGLEPQSNYEYTVTSICNSETITPEPVSGTFMTGCLVDNYKTIGSGTNTSYYIPVNNYYKYTYSQQLFLSSEMNGAADINSISFEYSYATPSTSKNNCTIYLGHTNQSAFNSTSDYISLSNLQKVYQGNLNCQQGWNKFQFDTIFHYNGTSNLVLVVDDNSSAYNSSTYTFKVHTASFNSSLYYYSDSNNPDPSDPTAVTTISATSTNRNNVKFGSCDETSDCTPPVITDIQYTDAQATITWVPGYQESAWKMEYKSAYDTSWTIESSVTSPHTILNLISNTAYEIRLYSDCDEEFSFPVIRNFTTRCGSINIPYSDDFENYSTGSTAAMPCWTRSNDYSSYNYPNVSSIYAVSGTKGLYFFAGAGQYNLLATSQFVPTLDLSTVQVSLNMRASTTASYLVVGVMTNPENIATFEAVDTFRVSTANTFQFLEMPLTSYTGTGSYIALMYTPSSSTGIYIDDFSVDLTPACPRPSSLIATSSAADSVLLSWTDEDGDLWNIIYGPTGFNPDSTGVGTMIDNVTETSYVVNQLTGGVVYDFYVRRDCGGGEVSLWNHTPATASPYTVIMGATASETITACGVTITDNGGINGNYSNYCNSILTIMPEVGMLVQVQGTYNTESNYDYLYIYDGIGTSGALLWSGSGTGTVPQLESTTGPLTIKFTSDESGQYSGFALTVSCTPAPSCMKPFNVTVDGVTSTTATISWTGIGSATAWNIEYGPAGFTQGSGTTMNASTNPYTLTGLTASTNYDVYVQSDCGSGDLSAWSSVVTLSTYPCDDACAYTINMTDAYGDGWNNASITVTTSSGTQSVTLADDFSGSQNIILCPVGSMLLSWNMGLYDDECAFTIVDASGTVLYTCTDASSLGSGTFFSTTCGDVPSTCNTPTNLQVSNVTDHAAYISWTAGGSETAWNLQYKKANESSWSISIPVNTTPANGLAGLDAETAYQVRVQADCGEGNVSGWVTKTFTTQGTGISNVGLANSISIMPNPAENYIELTINSNISVKEASIYNAFGQLLQKVTLTDNYARINVSGMAAGMYFVRIANDNTMATKKFIKK